MSRETHLGKASAGLKRRSTGRGTQEMSGTGLGRGPQPAKGVRGPKEGR